MEDLSFNDDAQTTLFQLLIFFLLYSKSESNPENSNVTSYIVKQIWELQRRNHICSATYNNKGATWWSVREPHLHKTL